jgi:hypothetical protein
MYKNGKMRPVETIPRTGGEGKGEWLKGWIQLWYIVRTFVKITIYPQYNNNLKREKIKSSEFSHDWFLEIELLRQIKVIFIRIKIWYSQG